MAKSVRDLMTSDPRTLGADDTAVDAAKVMRDADIGPVLVIEGGEVRGIVTDRDIVIRAVAEDRDPDQVKLGELCSGDVVTVEAGDDAHQAARLMREHNVRRLPVVDNGEPVGIVSIGDLAEELDPESALADISAAPADE
jgi:CBS domain-containing protein